MKEKKKITVMDIVLLILSVGLCVGIKFVFHACAVEGESVMACHWAEQAVLGVAVVLSVQSFLLLCTGSQGTRKGLSLAMIPTALLVVVIPGGLIRLCMMDTMRCHSVMQPAVTVFGIIIAVCAVINAVLEWRRA